MYNTTRIIELYGLPGCGKTTIRENLVHSSSETTSYARMTELSQKYNRLSLYKKLVYIPYKTWFRIILFLISMPIHKHKEWILYRKFFILAVIYKFSRHTKGYNYIIIDHGFIQSLVSLMNGNTIYLSNKQRNRFLKIIKSFPLCTFVYCSIPVELSMERIHKRNRGYGRLDVIKDDKKLIQKLIEQENIFTSVNQMLNDISTIDNLIFDSTPALINSLENFKKIIEL